VIEIIFRELAVADLNAIRDYYLDFSHKTFEAVAKDIEAALHILQTFPESGSKKTHERREAISPKYRFKISYQYRNGRIEVIGVYRFQNR
jgi:plasmid stabilization system protein ParE